MAIHEDEKLVVHVKLNQQAAFVPKVATYCACSFVAFFDLSHVLWVFLFAEYDKQHFPHYYLPYFAVTFMESFKVQLQVLYLLVFLLHQALLSPPHDQISIMWNQAIEVDFLMDSCHVKRHTIDIKRSHSLIQRCFRTSIILYQRFLRHLRDLVQLQLLQELYLLVGWAEPYLYDWCN